MFDSLLGHVVRVAWTSHARERAPQTLRVLAVDPEARMLEAVEYTNNQDVGNPRWFNLDLVHHIEMLDPEIIPPEQKSALDLAEELAQT